MTAPLPDHDPPQRLLPELTQHQERIAVLIAEGRLYKQVAHELRITVPTVQKLCTRIAAKLMPDEPDLTCRERILVGVRYRQWERQREAGSGVW